MTDKQPEALRLAQYLFESAQFHPQLSEDEPGGYASEFDMVLDEAAAELRRLHEVNAELLEALKRLSLYVAYNGDDWGNAKQTPH